MRKSKYISLFASIAALCAIGLISLPAKSGSLDGALDSMFNGMAVEPSLTENSKQKVLSGGYVRLRSPHRRFNIVSFNPPRISAGCGGIDLYGGSFSFIDGEQFRALLRQVGSQTIGYAFNVALVAICGDCMSIMNTLQEDIAKMNELLSNTCQWAQGIVTTGVQSNDALVQRLQSQGMNVDTHKGVGDHWESFTNTFQTSAGHFTNANKQSGCSDPNNCSDPTDAVNSKAGNSTAKTMFMAGTSGMGKIDGLTDKETKELFLNVLGFTVAVSQSDEEEATPKEFMATIRFADLLEGNSNKDSNGKPKQVYKCVNVDLAYPNKICTEPQVVDWQFTGTREWVTQMFLGKKKANSEERALKTKEGFDPIVRIFAEGKLDQVKPAQQKFLFGFGKYGARSLMRVQGDHEAVSQVSSMLMPLYYKAAQIKLAEAVLEQLELSFQKGGKHEFTDTQKANLAMFREELSVAKREFDKDYSEKMIQTSLMINELKK